MDDAGGAVVTGDFEQSMQVGSSTLSTKGSRDILVVALDRDGNVRFGQGFGGPGTDSGTAVASGPAGPVVVGRFRDTVDLVTGNLTSKGLNDVLALSLTPQGALSWARSLGGPGLDEPFAVARAPNGDVLVFGNFTDTITDGTRQLTSAGAKDVFVWKIAAP